MQHEVLGEITRDGSEDEGSAKVQYGDRVVEIQILAEDETFEDCVELAASAVRRLQTLDVAAKRVVAADLTEVYNGGWNEYDEPQEDGSVKTVAHPELSEDELAAKLTLDELHVRDTALDFFYDNQDLFWGHTVMVCSRNGTDLADASAELFG